MANERNGKVSGRHEGQQESASAGPGAGLEGQDSQRGRLPDSAGQVSDAGRHGAPTPAPDRPNADLAGDPLEQIYNQLKRYPSEYGRSDDPAKSRWPEAHALMARVHFQNGKSREPGRLTVQLGPTGVEWQLVDVTMGYKLVGGCDHLSQLWESVQAAATSPSAKWMPLRYGEGYQLRKQMERKMVDDAKERR